MKRFFYLFLFALLLFSQASQAQFRVVGYLPMWGDFQGAINETDFSMYTHVNLSFINPSSGNNPTITTDASNNNLINTAVQTAHAEGAKILISLGGAAGSNSGVYATALNSQNRSTFVTNLIDFIDKYDLDGIDVDLEGSAASTNYGAFVSELSTALQPGGKLVTSALATWYGGDIPTSALNDFDFINIMSYDATGPWGGYGQHSSYQMAVSDLDYWENTRGINPSKLVVGLPCYGYDFANNAAYTSYRSLVYNNAGAENLDQVGETFYNGIPTILQKTNMALQNASGIMFWEITLDAPTTDSRSLILAAVNEIANNSNTPPTIALSTPFNTSIETQEEISFTATASDSDGSITSVTFYVNGTLKATEYSAPYEYNFSSLQAGQFEIYAIATDNENTTKNSQSIDIIVSVPQSPYSGEPAAIPGTLIATEYDFGGAGKAYADSDEQNNGDGPRETESVDTEATQEGNTVGWIEGNEWIEYTVNVEEPGNYTLSVRTAAITQQTNAFYLEVDGINVTDKISVPSSGDWATFQTVEVKNIQLTSGVQVLRFVADKGSFNLGNMSFEKESITGLTSNDQQSIIIFPNPTTDILHVSTDLGGSKHIVIFDALGAIVKEVSLLDNVFELSTQELSHGIYQLIIEGTETSRTERFTKN